MNGLDVHCMTRNLGAAVLAALCNLLALCSLATAVDAAEAPRGRSQELGISFEVTGGDRWCGRTIRIVLTGAGEGVYDLTQEPLRKMVGRIWTIALGECDDVRRVVFDGRKNGVLRNRFEMTRLTGWRHYVPLATNSDEPVCTPPLAGTDACRKRVVAYLAARKLFDRRAFDAAVLSTFVNIQPEATAHVIWRDGDVVGKLTVIEQSKIIEAASSLAGFADALARGLAEQCAAPGPAGPAASPAPQIIADDRGGKAAFRTMRCPAAGTNMSQAIVATCGAEGMCVVNAVLHPTNDDGALPELWRVARED